MNLIGHSILQMSIFCILAQIFLFYIVESTKTKYGGDILYLDDQEWIHHYTNKQRSIQWWRCSKPKICNARAHSDYGSTTLTIDREHQHPPFVNAQLKRDFNEAAKAQGAKNKNPKDSPPREIWDELVKDMSREQLSALPSYSAFRQLIEAQRRLPETALLDKAKIKDIKIEGQHLLDSNNNKWLIYDSRTEFPEKEIFIFGSQEGIQRLIDYPHWAMDGTYSSLPCIYVLMNGKSEEFYSLLFQEIQHVLPEDFSPTSVILDNERAAVNAIHKAWPTTNVRLCLFHLAQAVYNRVKKEKLAKIYADKNDENVRFTVRRLTALAVLPVDLVERGFDIVVKNSKNKALKPVLNYFKRNYVKKDKVGKTTTTPLFPPSKWNHHNSIIEDIARSNNAVEGFNRVLNSRFVAARPKLSALLNALKAEDRLAKTKLSHYKDHKSEGIALGGKRKRKLNKNGKPHIPRDYDSHDVEIRMAVEDFDLLDTDGRTDAAILEHLEKVQLLLMRKKIDDLLRLPDDEFDDDDDDEPDIKILRADSDESSQPSQSAQS